MESWDGLPAGLKTEVGSPHCFLCEQPQRLVVPHGVRGQHKIWPLDKQVGGAGRQHSSAAAAKTVAMLRLGRQRVPAVAGVVTFLRSGGSSLQLDVGAGCMAGVVESQCPG